MRISDWSSDVCSSDLNLVQRLKVGQAEQAPRLFRRAIDLDMELHRSPFALRRLSRAGLPASFALSPPRSKSEESAPWPPHPRPTPTSPRSMRKIGRASCRERVCQSV